MNLYYNNSLRLCRGFNLVEVMVAYVILSSALLGLAFMHSKSLLFINESGNRGEINLVVNEFIEKVRASGIKAGDAGSDHYTRKIADSERAISIQDCRRSDIIHSARIETICFQRFLEEITSTSNMEITPFDLDRNGVLESYVINVYWSDQQLSQGGQVAVDTIVGEEQCTGKNREWSGSGKLTWWPESGLPDPGVCLVFHSWQFEVM